MSLEDALSSSPPQLADWGGFGAGGGAYGTLLLLLAPLLISALLLLCGAQCAPPAANTPAQFFRGGAPGSRFPPRGEGERNMSAAPLAGMSVEELLQAARDNVNRGEGSVALDAVVRAIRAKCGEENLLSVLDTAKRFAESESSKYTTDATRGKTQREILHTAVSGEGSLLAETYSDASDALKQAVKSGDSRVCTRCGDVVATARLEAHSTKWCPALPDTDDD